MQNLAVGAEPHATLAIGDDFPDAEPRELVTEIHLGDGAARFDADQAFAIDQPQVAVPIRHSAVGVSCQRYAPHNPR